MSDITRPSSAERIERSHPVSDILRRAAPGATPPETAAGAYAPPQEQAAPAVVAPPDVDLSTAVAQAATENAARLHQVADITFEAVGEIASSAAIKIEAVADQIDAAAKTVSDPMRKLAAELRHHGNVASENLKGFVDMANSSSSKVNSLADFIRKNAPK